MDDLRQMLRDLKADPSFIERMAFIRERRLHGPKLPGLNSDEAAEVVAAFESGDPTAIQAVRQKYLKEGAPMQPEDPPL